MLVVHRPEPPNLLSFLEPISTLSNNTKVSRQMDSAINIGLILLYSTFGAGSAVLAKTAVHGGTRRRWFEASLAFILAVAFLVSAVVLLLVLLHRMPVGLVVPIAVGFNLLLTSLGARVFFHEPVLGKAIAGNGFIVAGIAILSATS